MNIYLFIKNISTVPVLILYHELIFVIYLKNRKLINQENRRRGKERGRNLKLKVTLLFKYQNIYFFYTNVKHFWIPNNLKEIVHKVRSIAKINQEILNRLTLHLRKSKNGHKKITRVYAIHNTHESLSMVKMERKNRLPCMWMPEKTYKK